MSDRGPRRPGALAGPPGRRGRSTGPLPGLLLGLLLAGAAVRGGGGPPSAEAEGRSRGPGGAPAVAGAGARPGDRGLDLWVLGAGDAYTAYDQPANRSAAAPDRRRLAQAMAYAVGFPKVDSISDSTAQLKLKTTAAGTAYVAVLREPSSTPARSQVESGAVPGSYLTGTARTRATLEGDAEQAVELGAAFGTAESLPADTELTAYVLLKDSLGATAGAIQGVPFKTLAERCPAGTYSQDGFTRPCTQCDAGTACPRGSTAMADCAAGTFSAAGSGVCSACSPGSISGAKAAACSSCLPGWSSAGDFTACFKCGEGTYSTGKSATCTFPSMPAGCQALLPAECTTTAENMDHFKAGELFACAFQREAPVAYPHPPNANCTLQYTQVGGSEGACPFQKNPITLMTGYTPYSIGENCTFAGRRSSAATTAGRPARPARPARRAWGRQTSSRYRARLGTPRRPGARSARSASQGPTPPA